MPLYRQNRAFRQGGGRGGRGGVQKGVKIEKIGEGGGEGGR